MGVHMSKTILLRVASIVILTISAGSVCAGWLKDPFDANDALVLLYGGKTWTHANLKKYFDGRSTGYISLAFDASYMENNQEKHIVISHITPNPADDYHCHACTPLVGGAVYVKSKEGWSMESESKIIGWGSSLGEAISLDKIGPERYGIFLAIDDAHQGYETKYINLIIPYQGALDIALQVGFTEKPGPGACGKAAQAQKVGINFVKARDSEYFDVVANIKRNGGRCRKSMPVYRKTARYKFVNGKYEPLF